MKYFNLNKLTIEEYSNPVLMKINSKTFDMLRKIAKIVQKHRELEVEIIKEIAKTNNLETFEVNDLLADYDFLCDIMEYGNAVDHYALERTISLKEYNELRKQVNNER
ncbi:MAG: hypothetical protein IKL54_07190 [Bacteroidaceae bacterium]|nr:hypothetical protein [Bacteroidaceae bacterium]